MHCKLWPPVSKYSTFKVFSRSLDSEEWDLSQNFFGIGFGQLPTRDNTSSIWGDEVKVGYQCTAKLGWPFLSPPIDSFHNRLKAKDENRLGIGLHQRLVVSLGYYCTAKIGCSFLSPQRKIFSHSLDGEGWDISQKLPRNWMWSAPDQG